MGAKLRCRRHLSHLTSDHVVWSLCPFQSLRRETGTIPAAGWTGDDRQWCNPTLYHCLQSGEHKKHLGQLSHSPSSARAVVSPTKEQHSVDFKIESLRAGRKEDEVYTMPKISVLQQHLLLKHHEKVRHFYTFHVSAFCTQCPPPEIVSTWLCFGGMSQAAGMSQSWGWCSPGQLCSAPALAPLAMGLRAPYQQLWLAEPARRWAATSPHGLRLARVAMESGSAGSQTFSP